MAISLSLIMTSFSLHAAEIGGVIFDEDSAKPIPGATIEITELNLKVSTDSSGYFQIADIEKGYYAISATRLGYHRTQLRIEIGQLANPDLIIYLSPQPFEIAPVIVTSQHSHTKFAELSEISHTLKGKELQQELSQTLASTLKNETGIAMRSMGPAPARPVIRGLSGDRVLISEDGNKTTDLSATSPDHAVTIEPFSLERIEVVRGPDVLVYTSTAIGGIVNVIRHEIPQDPQTGITGTFGAYGETANRGYLNSAIITIPFSLFLVRGEINRKKTSDLNTSAGELDNSYSANLDYSLGAGLIKNWGFIGMSYREFDLDYGVPGGFIGAHPYGVDIEMFKRQLNLKGRLNINSAKIKNIEMHLARAYYRHKEFEADSVLGTEFKMVNHLGFINLNHSPFGYFDSGKFGIAFEYRDLDLGGLIFSPSSRSESISPYIIEYAALGKFNFEIGARFNHFRLKPDHNKPDARIRNIRTRSFDTFSASFLILYKLNGRLNIGGNISRSTRVPTLEELFSEGPHLAAYSYEVGNPELNSESGIGSELFVYYDSDKLYLMGSLFYNDLSDYIIHRNTGEINWTTVLPIYAASAVPARLYGIENQLTYNLGDRFTLTGSASYTHGDIKNTGNPLPQIPPLKTQLEIKYASPKLSFGINSQIASAQNRVDEFETATDGYAIFNAFAQYLIPSPKYTHSFSLSLDNAFNTEYRNHLSRVKSIMPEAGRNLRVTYKLFFDN